MQNSEKTTQIFHGIHGMAPSVRRCVARGVGAEGTDVHLPRGTGPDGVHHHCEEGLLVLLVPGSGVWDGAWGWDVQITRCFVDTYI